MISKIFIILAFLSYLERIASHDISSDNRIFSNEDGASHWTANHSNADKSSRDVFFSKGQEAQLFDYLTNQSRYEKRNRPYPSHVLEVKTSLYIYFFGNIEAHDLDFEAHLLLRQRWRDEKLMFKPITDDIQSLEGEKWFADNIWTPNIFIENEVTTDLLALARDSVYIRIEDTGQVHYHFRIRTTVFCEMYLRRFPHDSQKCTIRLESWTHPVSDLVLSWDFQPIAKNEFIQTEYRLLDVTYNESVSTYYFPEISPRLNDHFLLGRKPDGNYSALNVEFHFVRQLGHYLLDYYIPSILLVFMSWVSFWLEPNAVPGRVTLGTSTWLTFITLTKSTAGDNLPKVSYIKFLDIWFLICTIFIFSALIEFAIVNNIWRTKKQKSKVSMKNMTPMNILKEGLKEVKRNALTTPSVVRKNVILEEERMKRKSLTNMSQTSLPSLTRRLSEPSQGLEKPIQNLTVRSMDAFMNIQGFQSFPDLRVPDQMNDFISSDEEIESCQDVVINVPSITQQNSVEQQTYQKSPESSRYSRMLNKIRRRKIGQNMDINVQMVADEQDQQITDDREEDRMSYEEISIWIDTKARILFPISFFFFNVIYWSIVAMGL